jgi:hypothetical protein
MSKPRLILHIGLNKTGTSTIQHSLLVNEPRLRKAGFHLPDRLGRTDGGHHAVITLLKNSGPEAFLKHLGEGNTAAVTVVSAENFVTIFRDKPNQMARIGRMLETAFATEIVLFLRRQDYLKESVFAQVAKRNFQGSITEHRGFFYDFVPYIDSLERAFGRRNIKIIIYRDDERFDAWKAFCGVLEISPGDYPLSAGNANSSLPRRKTLALAMVPKRSGRLAITLTEFISNSPSIRDDGIRFLMSPDERREFLRRYLDGNKSICHRYEPEGSAFFCSDEILAENWYQPDPISSRELGRTGRRAC